MTINNVLANEFGISALHISEMEGYERSNFKVVASKGIFVLKIYAFTEEKEAILNAEDKIIEKASNDTCVKFPQSISTVMGEPYAIHDHQIYRLLSYVDGIFLAETEHTNSLCVSYGTTLANLDMNLMGMNNHVVKAIQTQWDLQHFNVNHDLLQAIQDSKQRSLVDYFFIQYNSNVLPVANMLRKSIIHNDANDWNILCNGKRIVGIIDFGDMCFSWLINEVAIALTYLLMDKEEPLSIAIPFLQGYHGSVPLTEIEIDILYYLIAARLCTSVLNSAHSKQLRPNSSYITVSEKPAWGLLERWLQIGPIRATDVFRNAVGLKEKPKTKLADQLNRRRKNISDALSLSYKQPIQMQRAAFQYMYDVEGNSFLDAYNNIMLTGHCHPKVVRAGQEAMARLNTNTRYIYEELLMYSESLLSKFPKELNKVFFVNSGSAASDLAIRMATSHSAKEKIMVMEHGYHGNTFLDIAISPYKYDQEGGLGRQPFVLPTQLPKVFGSEFKNNKEAEDYFSANTLKQIEAYKGDIAAFIAEPIVGCGGQVPLADGYLKKIYPAIRAQGGICISDEVQVGFGRLGKYFWGFEMHGVVPDMVILGKPMGNGHPIGAVVTTTEIAERFEQGPEFFSSFGGNPVSCAIGNAVLEVIAQEELQDHAKNTGDYLIKELQRLAKKFPVLADIRGSGLFLGVELLDGLGKPDTQMADLLKNELRNRYILIDTDGPYNNVLKIKPPLYFNVQNADVLVHTIENLLSIQ